MKRSLRLLGIAVAIAAFSYFVVYAYRALNGQDLTQLLEPDVMMAGGFLTVMCTLLIPLTAIAWSWLLKGLGQPVGFSITGPILATTQIGKYLPGNVAHHLGRVVVARAHGVETGRNLLSMAYETLLLLVACAHVSALTFLWEPPAALADWPLADYRGPLVIAISLGALITMTAAPWFARVIMRLRSVDGTPTDLATQAHPGWLTSLCCYLVYALNFALVGMGLWFVARALSPDPVGLASLALLIGAFASSWILGFLAPGAPAGLGVREAVLSVWLGGTFGAPVVVAIIILLRIATTLGDLLSFLWGSTVLARRRLPAQ
ncbi:lysylphosphatidylglycerol synthase domain-containing protein [Lysobacter sp. A286]